MSERRDTFRSQSSVREKKKKKVKKEVAQRIPLFAYSLIWDKIEQINYPQNVVQLGALLPR